MIAITTQLLTSLLGDTFVSWLNCDAIKVLVSLLVIGYVFVLFRTLVNK